MAEPAALGSHEQPPRTRYFAGASWRWLMIAASLSLAGCGAGDGTDADRQDPALPETLIELRTVGSRTAFMPDSLSAKAGTRVVLRLINGGEIAHNVVLVLNEQAVEPIVGAAYSAIATEYVPTGFDADILASTPLVYPGQSVDVSFVMPEPGQYTYVCVFPGHGSTMRGTLVSVP